MKKLISILLVMTLAVSLCVMAFASESEVPEPDMSEPDLLGPVLLSGEITPWGDDSDANKTSVYLKSKDENGTMQDAVVYLNDAYMIDATTGLPLEQDYLKTGNVLHAWIQPIMTMSLPPRVNALVIIGNLPENTPVPEYYEVTDYVQECSDNADSMMIKTTSGDITVSRDIDIQPWLTRQMVCLDGLLPGSEILVWKDVNSMPEKIVEFAYKHHGYLDVKSDETGVFCCVNGLFDSNRDASVQMFSCILSEDDTIMAPVRAVAEAVGYSVRWDRDSKSAVVSSGDEIILSAKPGSNMITMKSGETGIASACVLKDGVTYLPVVDMSMWLDMYLVRK